MAKNLKTQLSRARAILTKLKYHKFQLSPDELEVVARPSIAPSSEPPWGLPLTDPPRPYFLDYNRSRNDGRKLSTPSISRTLAARRGVQSTNLLAGLDVSLACAPSQEIP